MMFQPNSQISPKATQALMAIEVSRQAVSSRTALNLCNRWIEAGFILKGGEHKSRRFELAPQ
jgi:hypothetical protein